MFGDETLTYVDVVTNVVMDNAQDTPADLFEILDKKHTKKTTTKKTAKAANVHRPK